MPKIPLLAAGAAALVLGLRPAAVQQLLSQSTSSASSTSSATASSSASASSSSGSGGGLALAANPSGQLKFSTKTLTAKAGTVKINFTNMAPLSHNLTIEQGTSGPVVGATPTFMGGSRRSR